MGILIHKLSVLSPICSTALAVSAMITQEIFLEILLFMTLVFEIYILFCINKEIKHHAYV